MTFKTTDGYTLRQEASEWTDGDLTFQSDADGWPVDDAGERLEGDMAEEE